jgi:Tol biopolymer transport system component
MRPQLPVVASVLLLTAAVLACANPLAPSGLPSVTNVETMVALTLQALTAPASGLPPAPSASLLPHSLLFLNNDGAALTQVFRLEKDGLSLRQLTSESVKVESFDVSPANGSVAYVAGNQLLWIDSDGGNRRVIVDGGATDLNNPFLNSLSSPVWSPNGETLAYGHNGLNFYSVASGVSNRLLENLVDNTHGFPFPTELYWPKRYSPDGTKLLMSLGYYEGGALAVYYPSGNALVRLTGTDSSSVCCDAEWNASGTALFAASPTLGMLSPGLWRINPADGVVTTLLPGDAGGNHFNFAQAATLGPDGQLYYFFANLSVSDEFISRPPLQLVRSAPDGVTGRTVLRPETFTLINEALWSPDASFVIVATASIDSVYQGGRADLYYVDGRAAVTLAPFAQQMRWGP